MKYNNKRTAKLKSAKAKTPSINRYGYGYRMN